MCDLRSFGSVSTRKRCRYQPQVVVFPPSVARPSPNRTSPTLLGCRVVDCAQCAVLCCDCAVLFSRTMALCADELWYSVDELLVLCADELWCSCAGERRCSILTMLCPVPTVLCSVLRSVLIDQCIAICGVLDHFQEHSSFVAPGAAPLPASAWPPR